MITTLVTYIYFYIQDFPEFGCCLKGGAKKGGIDGMIDVPTMISHNRLG